MVDFKAKSPRSPYDRLNPPAAASGPWSAGTGTDSAVLTGEGNTASAQASVASGNANTASGPYSHAEGTNNHATGYRSHVEGYSCTAGSGPNNHAEGSQSKAVGSAAHAEGYNSTANGDYSHVEGEWGVASAQAAHVEGNGCTVNANGQAGHAEGSGCVVNQAAGHAEGSNAQANTPSEHAHACVTRHANGDSQFSRVVLAATNSNGVSNTVNLSMFGGYCLLVPPTGVLAVRGLVVARQLGAAISAMWELSALVRDQTIVTQSVDNFKSDSAASSWTAQFLFTGGSAGTWWYFSVAGTAPGIPSGTEVDWVATIESTQLF